MTVQTLSGFQAVEEIFLNLPKTVTWTATEERRLEELFKRGHELNLEASIVDMVFHMNKPFVETDDEIENMLNSEAYRFEFEANNPTYLEMKRNEMSLQRDVLSFMEENLLCFSFAVMEMKKRLVEPYEIFDTYPAFEKVQARIAELTGILSNGTSGSEHPVQLRKTYYGMA